MLQQPLLNSVVDAFDIRTQSGQFCDQAFIAPFHKVNVFYVGGTLCSQAGNDQCGTGPEVMGINSGSMKQLYTGDGGGLLLQG